MAAPTQQPNSQVQQFIDMSRSIQNSSDPNAAMNNLANQNPMVASVMNLIKNSGGTPKDVFFALAKSKGIDPNKILSMLR